MNDERRTGMDDVLEAIGGVKSDVRDLNTRFDGNDEMTKKVYDLILGDGGEGLITKVAVVKKATENNEKSIGRLWKFVTYILAGSGVAAALTAAIVNLA